MNYVLKSGKLSAICKNKQADKKKILPWQRTHLSKKKRGQKERNLPSLEPSTGINYG